MNIETVKFKNCNFKGIVESPAGRAPISDLFGNSFEIVVYEICSLSLIKNFRLKYDQKNSHRQQTIYGPVRNECSPNRVSQVGEKDKGWRHLNSRLQI